MNFYCVLSLLCPMLFFSGFSSLAQPHPDSLANVADSYAVGFYRKKVGASDRLFNGREYKAYRAEREETPYLFLEWAEADLVYDGQQYESIPIMFDLRNSAVVINYKGGFLQLVKEKLSRFTMKGRTFVFLHPPGLSADFYELLYAGGMKLYSHRQRKIKERIDASNLIREFEEHVQWYVAVGNELHSVKSKDDFLALFPNQMLTLKTHIRKEKLHFKKSFEKDLIALSKFCDGLEQ